MAQDKKGNVVEYKIKDSALVQEIDNAVRNAVNEQGSITRSGWYFVSYDLAQVIKEAIENEKIILESKSKKAGN